MVKSIKAASDILGTVLGGVPANLASEVIVRIADKHADKIEGTFVGGLLKKSGVIPPNFRDELESLLKQSMENFFETHPEYVVDDIDEYFLSPTIQYCLTRFVLDGKTPNDDAIKTEVERLLATEPQLRRMNIPVIFNQFLDVFIAVLSSEQTAGKLLTRIQLTEHERAILKAIRDQTSETIARLQEVLRQRDPFRPYLEKLLNDYIRRYLQDNARDLLELVAEDRPEAVIRAERKRNSHVLDRYFLGQRFADEAQTADMDTGFEEAFRQYDERLLVLGEPGAGKTFTLVRYAEAAIKRRLLDPDEPLPLYGITATWDSEKQSELWDWLAEIHVELQSGDVKRELEQGRPLLLLDGLDELGREREDSKTKERYDPRLRFIKKIPTTVRVLLTCRHEDYFQIKEKADLKGAIRLKPLTPQQIEAYLHAQGDLWEVVKGDEVLLDILKTPLLLRIVAYAFREQPNALTGLRDLKEGVLRDAIFTAYIDRRYEHESLKYDEPEKELPFTLDDLWRDLGWIAMMNAAGGYGVTANVLTERDFWRVMGSSRSEEFIQFCEQLKLITEASDQTWRFIHLRLRDTLAYRRALPLINDNMRSIRLLAFAAIGGVADRRAIAPLLVAINNQDSDTRANAASALGQIGDISIKESLLSLLHDGDSQVRSDAAAALGQIGDAGAVDELLTTLHDRDAGVRFHAAWALAVIGLPSLDGLFLALSDSDADVRFRAATALGQIRDARAIDGLLAALDDNDAKVVSTVVTALGQIGDSRTMDGVLSALHHDDARVVSSAITVLGKIGDIRAADGLLAALHNSDDNVRTEAANALVRIWNERIIDRLQLALRDADADVRAHATNILGRVGDQWAVTSLLEMLHDSNANVRVFAVQGLGRIKDVQVLDALLPLLHEEIKSVRLAAIWSLGQIGDKRALDSLFKMLDHADPETCAFAVSAVAEIGGTQVLDVLVPKLIDYNPDIRTRAAYALAKTGDSRALDALFEAFRNSRRTVGNTAANALVNILGQQISDFLISMLQDPNDEVRYRSVKALGVIRNARAIDGILVTLADPKLNVSTESARSLGKIGEPRAVSGLLTALKDQSPAFRDSFVELSYVVGDDNVAVDALQKSLELQLMNFRATVVEAFGLIGDGDSKVVELLSSTLFELTHEDWHQRRETVQALGLLGNEAALRALGGWEKHQARG